MKGTEYVIILTLLLWIILVIPANAQKASDPSISDYLDENGHFQNPNGYNGSLNVSGFELSEDENGTPVFFPKSGDNPDNQYWTLESNEPGVQSTVSVLAVVGKDLYLGGQFTSAGGVPANYIARYNTDTGSWHALGDGVNNNVFALAVSGTDLYVGGQFTNASGTAANYIARYATDTGNWHALGDGVNRPVVRALSVIGKDLFVGGEFTSAGGVPANRIARYHTDTGSWHALGDGVSGSDFDIVRAFAVSGTDLYVGGYFPSAGGVPANHIARYDTETGSWHDLGEGVNSTVRALAVIGTDLYVGGLFNLAGGASANRIARYDTGTSSWHTLGDGVSNMVSALAVIGTDLYVGGDFSSADGIFASRIARYATDTGSWHALGGVVNNTVQSLVIVGTNLYVGGAFISVGGAPASHIARYDTDNENWHALGDGLNSTVEALVVVGTNVYVGGVFTSAGGLPASRIARYATDTGNWHALGDGVNSAVRALAVVGTDLYVGGDFTSAGGVPASRIARYETDTGSWHALGDGVNNRVRALAVSGTDLYVGGQFTSASGVPASRIARYETDTGSWQALGDGVNNSVIALAVDGTDLYVGGVFTSAGDAAANYIARYATDTGSWHTLGNGLSSSVNALAVVGSDLFVGGFFTSAGGLPASRIARYNTGTGIWRTLGNGLSSSVSALAVVGSDLYVGGQFSSTAGIAVSRIARYDTDTGSWHALGDGVNSTVRALAIVGTDLYVGGQFITAGNKPASRFARWSGPELDPSETYTASLHGPHEGWRILGAPVADATYSDFFNGLWTQGFPGAAFEGGDSSVFWYDEATREFNAPVNSSNIIGSNVDAGFNNAGRGMLSYIYDDDFNDGTSVDWPKSITVTGLPHEGDIAVVYNETIIPENEAQGWHIASNPYPFPISWVDLVADNANEGMLDVIFVFDANLNGGDGGYRTNSGFEIPEPGPAEHDGILAPFQGLWVRTSGDGPSGTITFRESYQATGGNLYDAPQTQEFLAFSMIGPESEAAAALVLNTGKESSTGMPALLSPEEIRFGFDNPAQTRPDVYRSMEAGSGDQFIIPLDFAATESGTYSIELDKAEQLTGTVDVTLIDQLYGEEYRLHDQNQYSFYYEASQKTAKMSSKNDLTHILNNQQELLLSAESRFELVIIYGNATTIDPDNQLPIEISLSQNYPNPFNPNTQIEYALPEPADVRLEVYNIMGQRVASLVNGQETAGYHSVNFNASSLASGMYIYRLQAGSFVQTRKMMLVK
jgi:hypothetical protein